MAKGDYISTVKARASILRQSLWCCVVVMKEEEEEEEEERG